VDHLSTLIALAWHGVLFSLFAVGGGISILIPQMHQEFVHHYRWLTDKQFGELLAVSQAAPGPNFLLLPLIGWRVAAWPGVIVSLVSFLACPIAITLFVSRWLHARENVWIAQFRRAFRPVTAGLWIAAGLSIAIATDRELLPAGITLGVTAISLAIDISPLWWCVVAGIAGALLVRA
jgi:chromate transporter